MQEITTQELYDWYLDTLENFGSHLLQAADDLIEYYAFEEFHTGAISFLHESSLRRLQEAGLISADIVQKSLLLRSSYLSLESTGLWNVASFKTSPEWEALLELADEILILNRLQD